VIADMIPAMVTSTSYDDVVAGLPVDEAGFAVLKTSATGVSLPGHGRLLALQRVSPWWLEPKVVSRLADVPADTLLLLWERDDSAAPFGAMLALATGKRRASFRGEADGLTVDVQGLGDASADPVAVVGAGREPRGLVAELMGWAQSRLGTFELRANKPKPAWIDALGWCTWNTLGQGVDEAGVIAGLTQMRDAGVTPKFMILDDGWMQHDQFRLTAFEPDPAKFPSGLAGLIDRVKSEFGVERFGVWHTLQGHWMGVAPDGPLAKNYCVIQRPVNDWAFAGIPNDQDNTLGTVHPDDIGRFFDDWHATLAGCGVDMIKVDNQGSMQGFGGEEFDTGINRTELAKVYQSALQASAYKHFHHETLGCMSMDNTLACAASQGNVARSSGDYDPRTPAAASKHVHHNAKNALWADVFAVADWDMFQTRHPAAHFHAAARAISGGPVYLSDKLGEHDAELVHALAGEDGRVLRYNGGSAMATTDRWLVEVESQPKLLKVCNTHRVGSAGAVAVGVLGLFHCQHGGSNNPEANHGEDASAESSPSPPRRAEPITDTWTPADIDGLVGERFAAWSPTAKSLRVFEAGQQIQCTLSPEAAELVQLVPIKGGYAPLGLLDRLNGGAAFEQSKGRACRIKAAGRFGAYAETPPSRVVVNGQEIDFTYDAKTHLLTAPLVGEAPFDVRVQ